MRELWNSRAGILSTQVLQECFLVLTQKIPKPLNPTTAREIIEDLLKWEVVVNDEASILEAIDIHRKYRYSFWDSLIIQAALKGGATLLLSEDLQDNHLIQGMRIKNPFLQPTDLL